MGRASQRHKAEIHGALVTPADAAWTDAVAITPVEASAFFDDPYGRIVGYTLEGAPTGITIDAGTGQISGTPSGTGTNNGRICATYETGGVACVPYVMVVS